MICHPVKLLLAFACILIPGFTVLEIQEQDFYSLIDMYVFRNGDSSLTKEVSVFLFFFFIIYIYIKVKLSPRLT
jgi:hypothetical protein